MTNRYPLIVDTSDSNKIKELPDGDNLQLSGNSIVGAVNITASGALTIGSVVAATSITIGGTAISSVATSGSYTDLTNTPTAVSTFTNDSNYVTTGSNVSVFANNAGYLTTVAYADLTSTPTTLAGYGITVATDSIIAAANSAIQPADNVSTLTNDSGYITLTQVQSGDISIDVTNSGDLIGSVFSQDSTLMVDAILSSFNLDGTIRGHVTPAQSEFWDLGTTDNLFRHAYLSGTVNANTAGVHTGDTIGSVFGDDSTLLVDGNNNKIVGPVDTASLTVSSTNVAIGNSAGLTTQGANAVAVGNNAGSATQGSESVAIGVYAGRTTQGAGATALGSFAGANSQGTGAVGIGYNAGYTGQGIYATSIGPFAGRSGQAARAVSIGISAGYYDQATYAVAIGGYSGYKGQGSQATAVGYNAGHYGQSQNAVAIGYKAGAGISIFKTYVSGGVGSTTLVVNNTSGIVAGMELINSIGYKSGQTVVSVDSGTSLTISAVADGTPSFSGIQFSSGGQGLSSVAIGSQSGERNQGAHAIAIGMGAGNLNQAANSIVINATGAALNNIAEDVFIVKPVRGAVGTTMLMYDVTSGEVTHTASPVITGDITGSVFGDDSTVLVDGVNNKIVGDIETASLRTSETTIALGGNAGATNQGVGATAVGDRAGSTSQGAQAVAIGENAGYNNQSGSAVAVGNYAGNISQGDSATALGKTAGYDTQGDNAVAVGYGAGSFDQGDNATALGNSSGYTGQGADAIAIGDQAGYTNQAANSIVINATGNILNNTQADAFVVKPIRGGSGTTTLMYDASSGEITHTATPAQQTMIGSVQQISGPGAIDVTSYITEITTTGADAYTLADGVAGQIKIISMIVDGGDATITPTTLATGTTITMADVNDNITLLYGTNGWVNTANQGTIIA